MVSTLDDWVHESFDEDEVSRIRQHWQNITDQINTSAIKNCSISLYPSSAATVIDISCVNNLHNLKRLSVYVHMKSTSLQIKCPNIGDPLTDFYLGTSSSEYQQNEQEWQQQEETNMRCELTFAGLNFIPLEKIQLKNVLLNRRQFAELSRNSTLRVLSLDNVGITGVNRPHLKIDHNMKHIKLLFPQSQRTQLGSLECPIVHKMEIVSAPEAFQINVAYVKELFITGTPMHRLCIIHISYVRSLYLMQCVAAQFPISSVQQVKNIDLKGVDVTGLLASFFSSLRLLSVSIYDCYGFELNNALPAMPNLFMLHLRKSDVLLSDPTVQAYIARSNLRNGFQFKMHDIEDRLVYDPDYEDVISDTTNVNQSFDQLVLSSSETRIQERLIEHICANRSDPYSFDDLYAAKPLVVILAHARDGSIAHCYALHDLMTWANSNMDDSIRMGDLGVYLNRSTFVRQLKRHKVFALVKLDDTLHALKPVNRAQYVAIMKNGEGLVPDPGSEQMLDSLDERKPQDYIT